VQLKVRCPLPHTRPLPSFNPIRCN